MLQFLLFLVRDALLLLGYVSGGGSFPKPLSRAEEAQALAAMAQGDEDARAKLIEHNLRLVAHVVRKYTVPGCTPDDLVSVGTLGLIKAVSTYRPDAPTPLSTYAARCIENEVLMLLRSSKKRKNEVSLNDLIGMDGEGNDICFQDILGTLIEQFPGFCQCQAALAPDEERDVQLLLQFLNLRAERRLADVQDLRRFCNIQFLRDRHEVLQCPQFHGNLPPVFYHMFFV